MSDNIPSSIKGARRARPETHFVKSIRERNREALQAFSERASALLDSQRMSQTDLRNRINEHFKAIGVMDKDDPSKPREVHTWELSRWLLGKNSPNKDAIKAVAAVFGVEPDDLVPGISATPVSTNNLTIKADYISSEKGWFWEFRGIVGKETHNALMNLLSNHLE